MDEVKEGYDGKVYCPKCGNDNPAVETAYGFRTCCGHCGVRWTRIRGESEWVAETYSPMRDNCEGHDAKA